MSVPSLLENGIANLLLFVISLCANDSRSRRNVLQADVKLFFSSTLYDADPLSCSVV